MRFHVVLLAVLIWPQVLPAEELPPPPPAAGEALIDCLDFATPEAARSTWKAMWGTAPVMPRKIDGRPVLELPCNLEGTRMDRASWDGTVDLDLTTSAGIEFQFFCRNLAPISHLNLYLKSGDGWYTAPFSPPRTGGWCTVRIDKSRTRIEGRPAGWGHISTLRLSAWRGRDVNTTMYVAGLRRRPVDAVVIIARGESIVHHRPQEATSVTRYAETMEQCMRDLGLAAVTNSDLDLDASRLRGIKLVMLPYNPGMPDRVIAALESYMKSGGKIMAFYQLPGRLRKFVGIGGGQHLGQRHPGYFSAIHPVDGILDGAPTSARQRSWNINTATPIEGHSRVAAWWHDERGRNTTHAAVVVSESCMVMSHVLLFDDPAAKQQLLLSMAGHFLPELWRQASESKLQRIGIFGPYENTGAAVTAMRQIPGNRRAVKDLLARVELLRIQAREHNRAARYPAAIECAGKARDLLIEAHCSVQRSLPGEHRAFWCHSAFGVEGMEWDEAIATLSRHGFTAILPNMLWGGTAYYQSELLPVAREVSTRGDQIAACLKACKKYDIECHVWKVNWNMSGRAPREFVAAMKKAGRTQVRFDGVAEDRWLCPSHPDNQKLEIDSMVEVARKYDVDGIHFDYIRYPGPQSCFCPGCRQRFEQYSGRQVEKWPAAVRRDAMLRERWLEFRRGNITRVVEGVARAIRRLEPEVEISAAVFANWPVDRDGVGQDWKLWCERGYLDFVCPMDYTPSSATFERKVTAQLEWSGKVPCYPGIGLSTWPDRGDICKLIEQIDITRRLKTGGFTIFNYGNTEARDIVPMLGKGMTRPNAR